MHEAVCTALEEQGITHVFGVPGTQMVQLFDALRKSRIRVVLAASETGAAFMANGRYRATGEVGVLATIGGPGFVWALPGVAEARQDSAALLHLVSAPAGPAGPLFRLQDVDQLRIARPLVKGVFTIASATDSSAVVREACRLALVGEPGPVVVQMGGEGPAVPGSPIPRDPGQDELDAVGDLLSAWEEARRPLLLVGQGALGATESIRSLAERGVPVLTTPSGRGALPEDHPASLAFDPVRGGVEEVNELLARADIVVGIGCKLGYNGSAGFRLRIPESTFAHVDTDPGALGVRYSARLAVRASAEEVLPVLARRIPRSPDWTVAELEPIVRRIRNPDTGHPEPVVHGPRGRTTPADLLNWLGEALPRDCILVTDSGLHQNLVRRYYQVRAPRGLIFPSDFQSMGFGIPAAIGAAISEPARAVAAVVGDGGFLMSGMELATAVREGVELLVVVFNDGRLGQIRLEQLENHGWESAVRTPVLDLEHYAASIGARYLRYDRLESGTPLGEPGIPTLLEVRLGDSWAMRRLALESRVKGRVRTVLGRRAVAWLRTVLGR